MSLQRLASTQQVKISNYTMTVPSESVATKEANQYAEQIPEEEEEDMLLS